MSGEIQNDFYCFYLYFLHFHINKEKKQHHSRSLGKQDIDCLKKVKDSDIRTAFYNIFTVRQNL